MSENLEFENFSRPNLESFGVKTAKIKAVDIFLIFVIFFRFFKIFLKKKSIFGHFDPLFDPLLGKPYGQTPKNKIFQVKKNFFAKFKQNR